jgi:uncharacterized protein
MSPPSPGRTSFRSFAWGLGVALLAWSVVGNLLVGERWYIARNLALTAVVLVLAGRVGLTHGELGLGRRELRAGVVWGAWAVALVAVALVGAVALDDRVPVIARLLADDRAALPPGQLAFQALLRIPLGTAVFEEVVFRGALLAAVARSVTTLPAILGTSAVFGIWHVPPTIVALQLNDVAVASAEGIGAIVGAVLVTTVAGIGFCWLRVRSGSLLAPVLAHWATNALGLLAAASTASA